MIELRAVLLALRLLVVTQHPDALQLKIAADHYRVPFTLMAAVAYEESRHSLHPPVSITGDVGRMQINLRVWQRVRQCRRAGHSLFANRECGAYVLRQMLDRCHDDVLCAARRYQGGSVRYAQRVGMTMLLYELNLRGVGR